MKKSKDLKLNDLLDKVLNNPDEFYTKIADNLSIKEYLYIKDALLNKDCHTCNNGSCKIESYEKPIQDCIAWTNRTLIGKSKVLKINDINKLK